MTAARGVLVRARNQFAVISMTASKPRKPTP
jgi:hypothetical protein